MKAGEVFSCDVDELRVKDESSQVLPGSADGVDIQTRESNKGHERRQGGPIAAQAGIISGMAPGSKALAVRGCVL